EPGHSGYLLAASGDEDARVDPPDGAASARRRGRQGDRGSGPPSERHRWIQTDVRRRAYPTGPGGVKDAGTMTRPRSPRHGDAHATVLAIEVDEVPVRPSELVEPSRHLDVATAVLLDEIEAALAEPAEALQTVGALLEAEGRLRQVPEA